LRVLSSPVFECRILPLRIAKTALHGLALLPRTATSNRLSVMPCLPFSAGGNFPSLPFQQALTYWEMGTVYPIPSHFIAPARAIIHRQSVVPPTLFVRIPSELPAPSFPEEPLFPPLDVLSISRTPFAQKFCHGNRRFCSKNFLPPISSFFLRPILPT